MRLKTAGEIKNGGLSYNGVVDRGCSVAGGRMQISYRRSIAESPCHISSFDDTIIEMLFSLARGQKMRLCAVRKTYSSSGEMYHSRGTNLRCLAMATRDAPSRGGAHSFEPHRLSFFAYRSRTTVVVVIQQ